MKKIISFLIVLPLITLFIGILLGIGLALYGTFNSETIAAVYIKCMRKVETDVLDGEPILTSIFNAAGICMEWHQLDESKRNAVTELIASEDPGAEKCVSCF